MTVVMPVRNGEHYIAEAIESVLGQTLDAWELIVVFNGTTDRSEDIARRYAVQDARVRIVTLPSSNIATALNTGIALSRAQWVARMDADDIAEPERLERQLAFLMENPDVMALGTWGWRIGADGTRIAPMRLGPITRKAFFDARDRDLMYLISSSVIFSRKLAQALGGFRPDYPQAQDVEFWTRIADAHPILVLPELLVSYRIHEGAISSRQSTSQSRHVRRARLNMRRRRQGLPELDSEAFAELEHNQPRSRRIMLRLRDLSRHAYRRAGTLLASRNPKGIGWLLASLALFPPESLHRLHEQRVLLIARNQVKNRIRASVKAVCASALQTKERWGEPSEAAMTLRSVHVSKPQPKTEPSATLPPRSSARDG